MSITEDDDGRRDRYVVRAASARIAVEPRRQARRRTVKVLTSRPMVVGLVAMSAMVVAVVVGLHQLLRLTGRTWSPTTFGFLLGAGVVSVPWALWSTATEIDGSWSWRIGAVAERHTAEVLRRLGDRWRFQYDVVFYGGRIDAKKWVTDIDCVATGPGGVLAVSTKWTADDWDLSDPTDEWVLVAARGAARNAERLAGPLRQVMPQPPIVPVVVCWGPGPRANPGVVTRVALPGGRHSEVLVVHGAQADEWLPVLAGERLTGQQVAAIDAVVAGWIADHEERHSRHEDARRAAVAQMRRAVRFAAVSVTVTVLVAACWVAASVSRAALRSLDVLVGAGGGLGAVLFVVVPLGLPVASTLYTRRAVQRASRARLPHDRRLMACSMGALVLALAAIVTSAAVA